MKLRQGRKLGRTLYEMAGPEPSDADVFVGVVDFTDQAALIVAAVNAHHVAVHGCDRAGCRCRYCAKGTP